MTTAVQPQLFRSNVAMSIANVDRMAFNEAVADGHYGCAPGTKKGKVRKFTASDILVLYVFGRLREFGFTVNKAGSLACRLLEFFKDSEAALVDVAGQDSVTYVAGYTGALEGMIGHFTFDRDVPQRWQHPHAGVQFFRLTIELANVRRLIDEAAQEEAGIEQDDEG